MHRAFKDWHLHIKLFLTFFLFTSHQISLGKGFRNQFGKASCSSQTDSVSCTDLKGVGSLNNTCLIRSDLNFNNDLCIYGAGNIEVFQHVSIICPIKGCSITINVSGSVKIGAYAQVVAGSIIIDATNVALNQRSTLNTTALGGPPPSQTSGTPSGVDGAGGGHGGRGASCLKSNKTNWGGDVYAWATLADPWSYGSKGGSMSVQSKDSGDGGGRVMVNVEDSLVVDGYIGADGGESAQKGGGGSGGSIIVRALKLKGNGTISASGGRGWGGGGGGRISLECYSIQGVRITIHGGQSIGCPENSGAAGTYYDKTLKSLRVSNDNFTTHTETPLLDFPTMTLWANVFVENYAKALVPLLWSRVQVRGQIRLLDGGSICFGLADYPVSEFELVAEELLMSDSVIKVYGAFRMYVKMLLMWDSKIQIDGGGNNDVGTSVLEVRNLVVLRQNSIIYSNADLGIYGQGILKLTSDGDEIKAQRLFLSLFYNIETGPGSLLQAPLDEERDRSLVTKARCESQSCPNELIMPPDDCHVNNSLSYTLQICRVENISVNGQIKGSIIHVHRARTVSIGVDGVIGASELGCKEGIGKGKILKNGAGGGAGHGGKGGSGFYNGMLVEGGQEYGDADLPCELGSGGAGPSGSTESTAGGGMIVMGSIKWPISRLEILGSLESNGQSHKDSTISHNKTVRGGFGGGSGGTALLFLQTLHLGKNSSLSVTGGHGSSVGGGGGGGGRVHFDWSNIGTGDEYIQIASISGSIISSGGTGNNGGHNGGDGTVNGKKCPKGLYGTFCNECPVGTYKNVTGSNASLCTACSLHLLPQRAEFIYVRGGVTEPFCPYRCRSEKYRMPQCNTPYEDLIYIFGGPLPFAILLLLVLVLFAMLLSAIRIKMLRTDHAYRTTNSIQHGSSNSSPYLLSLAEVAGASRAEENQSHVHRMYFMGPNTFREPWHLPYSPPDAIIEIVYEDVFNRFIDEINSVSAYEWWEGSIHSILAVLAYPCSWSWKQWRRRKKIHRLQQYVKSEYDHSCLRSCRSRALYQGMKVGSTPDLMVAYIDFFLGGDEKRLDIATAVQQRFPMCIIFGGNGSFMSPYCLHTDPLLSNLLGQHMPTAIWNRLVLGLNAQLRPVRQGCIHKSLFPVILWINSHGNPQLEHHGFKVELGWFQATASGYYQLGIVLAVTEHFPNRNHSDNVDIPYFERGRKNISSARWSFKQPVPPYTSNTSSHKRITGGVSGGIITESVLKSLTFKRDCLFPFSLLLQNTMPFGLEDTLQLLICVLVLGDFTITLLLLFQLFWASLAVFLVVLLVLPLSLLPPFPAGLNALFSHGPKRSSVARIYALWNVTSMSNITVSFICGIVYYEIFSSRIEPRPSSSSLRREDGGWWVLPVILLLVKTLQACFINWHIANLEIMDPSLYSPNPEEFWEM